VRANSLATATVVVALAASSGALGSASLGACSRSSTPTEASPRLLVGAGATLPYPLYSRWAADYARVDPTVRINYQSVGSGAGIREVSDGVVDFGATDDPRSEADLRGSPTKLVHVPTTVGAVVLAVNLPGTRDLSLTGPLVADIFLGRIRRWDDPAVRARNPDRALPDEPIVVVHRADGSGTSAALTAFLARSSTEWESSVGSGTSPRFPIGVGAKGNEGVAALVKSTPLSIGYLELAYAKQAGLAIARVQNRAGRFVAPTLDALDRAARSVDASADAGPLSLIDAPDAEAYPIAAVSFVVVPAEARDPAKAAALARFLWWAIHDGQRVSASLDYAPLTEPLVARGERALRTLRGGGQPALREDGGGS